MVIPWIFYQEIISGARRKLSDIEFLSIKEFGGKLVDDTAQITTTTSAADIVSLTASSGKDLYLAKAKIKLRTGSSSALTGTVNLTVNGVVKESIPIHIDGSPIVTGEYKFVISGVKVLATQIIKLDFSAGGSASIILAGTLTGYEETTDDTPQIASI